ncbi:hypothetical protein PHMEG_00032849 [Phytophthora megakarya]|uniref:Uncharacterized protein n=1 Tax=Phytophthora megakarya TaxID=4795 RepID=A0A225UUG8_9STRA|nr:hypothetical protein PHMEG_00032849 [Phytophthora megakarya]
MSLAGVISGVPTLADTGLALAPVSWDAPPFYNGPDVHLVGVPASVAALRSGAKVFPGHGGLEVLLCFESLDATDLQDLDRLMGGDVANYVSSIAGQRELAALEGQFPLDRLAERMSDSFSFIRRLLAKIRHLQAASEDDSNGTLSSETLVARDNFNTMRREWTVMCRHWGQRVRSLERARADSENFLRQGHRDAESRHQARITELTDQVAQLQGQLRNSEAARQAAKRRAEERVLNVNALIDFLMGNKPKINVMFNWMRLASLLHHFAEGTPIPEGWLTNINVVALDDPRCECPEYVKPSPRPGNGNSSSGSSNSRRPSVLDLSPPARNKRASTSGSRTGSRKRKASGARDVPMAKRVSLSSARDSGHQLDLQLRPRGYSPRYMLVYSPRTVPNARDPAEAGRAHPDGMLWTDVRADVQHLLLSGMDFKCAMKWVSESQGIHHLAPREAVCQMLTQVIHAGQVDETP